MYNEYYKLIRQILQTLAQDPTIGIIKPDKGCDIVIMDKDDFISKMENLLKDKSTYERIYEDSTNKNEDHLNRLLLRFLKESFITSEECEIAKPMVQDHLPSMVY